GALSERPAFAAHRSNIREWYCDHAPRPNTRPANIQFFEWFRRDCDFFRPRSQIVWQCDRLATTTPIGVRREQDRLRPALFASVSLWSRRAVGICQPDICQLDIFQPDTCPSAPPLAGEWSV